MNCCEHARADREFFVVASALLVTTRGPSIALIAVMLAANSP
jgi:hypothetical protein